ncbi:hypothetical protein SLA2020_037670 [Shorea laevis]
MTSGNGQYSYTCNSTLQKGVESLKALIEEAIQEKLDMKEVISSSPSKVFTIADSSSPSNVLTIADLGCSVGPNTFIAVQNIIEPVKLKYKSTFQDEDDLQFQVVFNDLPSNDFNTLFQSLPLERPYFADGIPGQFQSRLFPKVSLHLVHSSYALHWLSRTPKKLEVINKGSIYYHRSPKEVMEAYSAEIAMEIVFFGCKGRDGCHWRTHGYSGNMPTRRRVDCTSDWSVKCRSSPSTCQCTKQHHRNLVPLIKRNGCFSIERMEALPLSLGELGEACSYQIVMLLMRALFEGLIREHFGNGVVEELFDCYLKKMEECSLSLRWAEDKEFIHLFVLLKRKANC